MIHPGETIGVKSAAIPFPGLNAEELIILIEKAE